VAAVEIDLREKQIVLDMETSQALQSQPSQQKVPLEGDPFCLYLPRKHANIASYADKADFLPWHHCPLCHEILEMNDSDSFESVLAQHVQEKHALSLDEVRRACLETAMWRGPQAIPAQVLRTALHRFREALSDAAISSHPCACCVHGFSAQELRCVRFPAFPSPAQLPVRPA